MMNKKMDPPKDKIIPMIFRLLSNSPKDTYGNRENASRNPNRKPHTWAQLSIHGNKPRMNKKTMKPPIFRTAKQGLFNICILCRTSTNKQARIPN